MSDRWSRVILALLLGIGFTAVVALGLGIPSPIVLLVSLLLLPGGMIAAVISHAEGLGSPIPVLVFNSGIYSLVAYLLLCRWFRLPLSKTRLSALVLAIPVSGLVCLACMPAVSPLWPRGMSQLAEEEQKLREGLPVGSSIESARSFLKTQGIRTYEQEAQSGEIVFQDANEKLVASAGDRLLKAQIPTQAGQSPCGYRIDVILAFDGGGRIAQSHIQRFPICP